jgi:hypothetical protein
MSYRIRFLILCIVTIISNCVYAQLYSTIGKEFWVSIPRQYTYPGSNNITSKLYITGLRDCDGTLQNKFGTYNQSFKVKSGKQTVLDLPNALFYTDEYEKVDLKGALIQSTDSIQVVMGVTGIGGLLDFYEMTNLIPTQSLGSDYLVMTYAYSSLSISRTHSNFTILAVEDSTVVEVSPNQVSVIGTVAIPFKIVLNKGETFFYQAYQDLDLTGSYIHALNCKKIIVYSGSEMTYTPNVCQKASLNN